MIETGRRKNKDRKYSRKIVYLCKETVDKVKVQRWNFKKKSKFLVNQTRSFDIKWQDVEKKKTIFCSQLQMPFKIKVYGDICMQNKIK